MITINRLSVMKKSQFSQNRNYKPVIRTKQQMEDMGAFDKPDYTPMPNTSNLILFFKG